MSADKYKNHIIIIIEDDKNRQIVNGFTQNLNIVNSRQIETYVAGGWPNVKKMFIEVYEKRMTTTPYMYLVLVADFDNKEDRYDAIFRVVPDALKDRVMLVGARGEPEDITWSSKLETLGRELAEACFRNEEGRWGSEHLCHNLPERERVGNKMRSILFG